MAQEVVERWGEDCRLSHWFCGPDERGRNPEVIGEGCLAPFNEVGRDGRSSVVGAVELVNGRFRSGHAVPSGGLPVGDIGVDVLCVPTVDGDSALGDDGRNQSHGCGHQPLGQRSGACRHDSLGEGSCYCRKLNEYSSQRASNDGGGSGNERGRSGGEHRRNGGECGRRGGGSRRSSGSDRSRLCNGGDRHGRSGGSWGNDGCGLDSIRSAVLCA